MVQRSPGGRRGLPASGRSQSLAEPRNRDLFPRCARSPGASAKENLNVLSCPLLRTRGVSSGRGPARCFCVEVGPSRPVTVVDGVGTRAPVRPDERHVDRQGARSRRCDGRPAGLRLLDRCLRVPRRKGSEARQPLRDVAERRPCHGQDREDVGPFASTGDEEKRNVERVGAPVTLSGGKTQTSRPGAG